MPGTEGVLYRTYLLLSAQSYHETNKATNIYYVDDKRNGDKDMK